ncbi:hypothetical protein [Saccharopolyspora erythraea]|uniref:hypothetical protein n=1 Tax=Saccharopolyspora erythraea TaxID=1836 RepID=UPI00187CFA50|nr:hypothetical protein [Saccharopolyspora erythraea]QRK91487.1 hypothetical protein JQX30_08890 [Saccharopolyspora erythraea]
MNEGRLVLGGYVAAARAVRTRWQNAEVLPRWLVTASGCIARAEPGPEAAWHTDRSAAQRRGTGVLAVGFEAEHAAGLVEEITADFVQTRGRRYGHQAPDCLELLVRGAAMPADARLRGFEVIGVEWNLSHLHSWLCHGYEAEAADELGVRPNRFGLLDTHRQACEVLEWMDSLPAACAPEPVYWTVAAVAECGGPEPQRARSDSLNRAYRIVSCASSEAGEPAS